MAQKRKCTPTIEKKQQHNPGPVYESWIPKKTKTYRQTIKQKWKKPKK